MTEPQATAPFTVTLTRSDLALFAREYCWTWKRVGSLAIPIVLLVAAALAVMALCTVLFTILERAAHIDIPKWLTTIVSGVAAFFAYLRLAPFAMRLRRQDLGTLADENSYRIADDGIATESINGTGLVRWRAFRDILVTKSAAYLGLGASRALVIPRRAFADGASFDEFVATVRARTGLSGDKR